MGANLLELKNIGKIYVSESNVSVGIRGVDLAFNRGEFVAVTGKSGSGKSTLLNVISGMDTYEEGELYIEGEPTSHYMQRDWEAYRKQYISFIFQDYNIIESFTVLQNVELALMDIENARERRQKALELLRRVGLEKHIHHKGSKLSGGQKQRTVIARALAKDSPIILADEPTGNLDSQSSKEIIELLREVSKDKLVIIVTHNFDQVEAYATRHIRIFDGAVESDHTICAPAPLNGTPTTVASKSTDTAVKRTTHTLRNGLLLGRVRFMATPKLSVFLCILMLVTALVITMISSMNYEATRLFDDKLMFTHLDGRVVIVRRDGAIITDEELDGLAQDVGAEDYMHYDSMLDDTLYMDLYVGEHMRYQEFSFGYPAESVKPDAGRYPQADNEVILEIPISFKDSFGGRTFSETKISLFGDMATYTVVGVRYYYDNTRTARMLFTENGYKIASALAFFADQSGNFKYSVSIDAPEQYAGLYDSELYVHTFIDFDMAPGSYYVNDANLSQTLDQIDKLTSGAVTRHDISLSTTLSGSFYNYKYDWHYEDYGREVLIETVKPGYGEEATVSYSFAPYRLTWDVSDSVKQAAEQMFSGTWQEGVGMTSAGFVVIAPDVLTDFMYEHYYREAYTQASLFFSNDREAHDIVDTLYELGYTAVVSDETVEMDVMELLQTKLEAALSAVSWLLTIVFATLFLSLCSSRAMNATRGDVAIMRSMGIPTGVVRVSIYVQTLISMIPATLITAVVCAVIYLLPQTNYLFPFLHIWDYVIIAVVLVGIALNLSRRYVKKMFSESVKKTLKGGSKA